MMYLMVLVGAANSATQEKVLESIVFLTSQGFPCRSGFF